MNCPRCNSTNYRKQGHTAKGLQRYYCKDCGKRFQENTITYTYKQCVYCGSEDTKRAGYLRSGAIRYYCKSCNTHFSDKTVIRDPINVLCPDCQSDDIRRTGTNEFGIQRYICKSCGRKFLENITKRAYKPYEVTCPSCGHKYAKKAGKTGCGNQYWLCLDCGHKYLQEPKYTHSTEEEKQKMITLMNNGLTAKEIGEKFNKSPRTIKDVLTKINSEFRTILNNNFIRKRNEQKAKTFRRNQELKRQRQKEKEREYQMKKDKIIELYTKVGMTQKQIAKEVKVSGDLVINITKGLLSKDQQIKQTIRKLILSGKNPDKVCTQYNYKKSNIYKLLEKDYEKETITIEQRNLIIKFGVMLHVPVEYLAEYVPCSEHMCKKIIQEYKHLGKPIIKAPLTKDDLAHDKMALEKFVGC